MQAKFRLTVAGYLRNKIFPVLLLASMFVFMGIVQGQSLAVTNTIETATATDNSTFVLLQWKVKDNVSVDHYEIERMDINGSYSTVAFILSDNNEETKQYKYKDKITVRDLHLFYRIKAVNMNGTEMFSEVMPLDLKSTGDGLVDIEYKKGSDFITLQLPRAKGSYIFRFYNIVGRMVKTKTVSASQKKIMIDDLKNGSYFIEAFHPQTGKRFYAKLVK
ncbi:MAG: hypothetical protein ABL872_14845 [Lacibacter sp.]